MLLRLYSGSLALFLWLGTVHGAPPPHALHVPAAPLGVANDAPLVVMLHGCQQDAQEFSQVTGMNAIADREGFFVLYPEQPAVRNPLRCWNWFAPLGGANPVNEASWLAALIRDVRLAKSWTGPVYVAGLSAGGAMAGALAACYPKLIRAAAVHSAPSFLRAHDVVSAAALMTTGVGVPAAAQSACAAFEKFPLLVIHGQGDSVVNPQNVPALMRDLAREKGASAQILIPGLGHAWAGGAAGHAYSTPAAVPASELIWTFFAGLAE